MHNREKIAGALTTGGPAAYAELRERSGVPVGSFDRVLTAMVDDGTITKADGRYHSVEGSLGDGGTLAGFDSAAYRGTWGYCSLCGTSHPKLRDGEWPSFAEACRLGIVA